VPDTVRDFRSWVGISRHWQERCRTMGQRISLSDLLFSVPLCLRGEKLTILRAFYAARSTGNPASIQPCFPSG